MPQATTAATNANRSQGVSGMKSNESEIAGMTSTNAVPPMIAANDASP